MEKHSTKGSALIDSHIDKHYININVYSYEKCAIIMTNSNNGFEYHAGMLMYKCHSLSI